MQLGKKILMYNHFNRYLGNKSKYLGNGMAFGKW